MPKTYDLVGQTFGRLTVIRLTEKQRNSRAWLCECACGKRTSVLTHRLMSGHTKSCGCLIGETTTARNTKHGSSKGGPGRRAYVVWMNMKGRCLNPNNPKYPRYGGRGIRVCDRWLDFRNFFADMGDRPAGATIDRINNDGNYEPGNCRWATPLQQQQNRSDNVFLTVRGRKACLAEWERITDVGRKTIRRRIVLLGWDPERAVSTPIDPAGGQFKPGWSNPD